MKNSNLKIGIIGYGSMGKELEAVAKEQQVIINDILDIDRPIDVNSQYKFDVAFDFSHSDAVPENIKVLCKLKKNIVLGTTGWENHFHLIKKEIENSGTGFIYGSNFSIGVQIFQKIVKYSCSLLNYIDGYDIMLFEAHHKRKKDSPSGTALKLADIIIKNVNKKMFYSCEPIQGAIPSEMLHITSLRGGEIIGNHSVIIDSLQDSIELTHRAKNRRGYAIGAIYAARWIYKKKGFYEINDMLDTLWEK
jgi:4-hydroxy-tetrahydrodipicolinate reductase